MQQNFCYSVLDPASQEELAELAALRIVVWSAFVPEELARERFGLDALDTSATHVCVRDAGRLIAAGRLSIHTDATELPDPENFVPVMAELRFPSVFLNRLVVHPDYRARGLSQAIDEARIAEARRRDARDLWIEAQGRRLAQLKARGFEVRARSPELSVPGDWSLLCLSTCTALAPHQ